ncbi:MAG: EamA family transporter, partial [Thermoanaerobaculia bacterium]
MPKDSRVVAQWQVVAAALLFSTGGAAVKAISLTSWQIAGFRSGIALVAILVMLPSSRRLWTWRTVAVGCAYAGAVMSYVLANRLTTAANTIFLFSTAPLYILFLGPWILKEPIRRRDLVLMATLAVGLGLIFSGVEGPLETASDPLRGNLVAALGGV